MNLLQDFKELILKKNLFSVKDRILLAVSGGVDSVVLCELCKQAGFQFDIAHCNFKLRGEESERDENFVRALGKKYGCKIFVKQFETEIYAAENKLSVQEAARELRYNWFKDLLTSSPDQVYHYLLTAHHADDNIETLLMNFFRGTGLQGLTGMQYIYDHIRRPLLDFSKEELIRFASAHRLSFVEDSSNESIKYTRNNFRKVILPAIAGIYPQVRDNLQKNINRFREIEKLYSLSVGELKKKICKKKEDEIHIPVRQLMAYKNQALIYEIISPYGFHEKQISEVEKLAVSESGKYIASPDNKFRIIKYRSWLIISPVLSVAPSAIIISEEDKHIHFNSGALQLAVLPSAEYKKPGGSTVACLDMKLVRFPLLLRKWKTGDYFYPFGMKKVSSGKVGKKKISRFLMDIKLTKTEKEKIWVIESDKRILWVVGYRIDERFKITDSTKQFLRITLSQ